MSHLFYSMVIKFVLPMNTIDNCGCQCSIVYVYLLELWLF